MASIISNRFKKNVLYDALNGKTIHAVLLTSSHTPDADQNTWGDISSNEVSDSLSAYTTGGSAVTGAAISQDDTLDRGKFTCDAPEWDPATIPNARYIVFLDWNAGTPSASEIIAQHDFGTTQAVVNGPLSWTPNSSGVCYTS